MTNDRKQSEKLAATKTSRPPKGELALKKTSANKAANRQKAGIVVVTGAARKSSKKTVKAITPAKPSKTKKDVRDAFKMPAGDYALIEALKQRSLEFNRPTKKNELLRAGLHALGALDNAGLQQRLLALEPSRQVPFTSRGSKAKS